MIAGVLFSWRSSFSKDRRRSKTYSIDWISPNIELPKKQEKNWFRMQEQIFILNLLFFVITVTTSIAGVFFNVNCVVLDCTKVTIGSNVFCSGSTIVHGHSPTRCRNKKNTWKCLTHNNWRRLLDRWQFGNLSQYNDWKGMCDRCWICCNKRYPWQFLSCGKSAKVIRQLNQ
jgi:hypothetical protein